jgi:hypothetical protein
MLGEEHYRVWGNLLHSVKTGECAFDRVYGQPIFDYYRQNPEIAAIFNEAMGNFSTTEIKAVMRVYDFSSFDRVVDVGGGYGPFITAILREYPRARGILFDTPNVIARASALLAGAGTGDRCQCIGGDFFESVPSGGDVYLLKHIVHDWSDRDALTILQHCRKAMDVGGTLLLVEQMIPEGNSASSTKLLDVNMLVMCSGGRERTETEYRELLARAGFKLARIVPTESEIGIIEGTPE